MLNNMEFVAYKFLVVLGEKLEETPQHRKEPIGMQKV